MKIRMLVVFFAGIFLSGCASMFSDNREEALDLPTFDNASKAAEEVPAVFSLEKGKFKNITIEKDVSPTIKLGGSVDYFEVVDVNVTSEEDFTFTIYAICDCFGFRKWAVLSKIIIIDPEGNEVEFSLSGDPQLRNIKGKFKMIGRHKILVVADSMFSGRRMGTVDGQIDYTNPATKFSLPLVVHPTGIVQVAWKK